MNQCILVGDNSMIVDLFSLVELRDIDGMLLDNMTVFFETLDTCFCYGHCGCAVSGIIIVVIYT